MNYILPGQISDRPLREANTCGSRHITGTILGSPKNRHIDWTGLNERQFGIRAVIDPRVTRILSQPVWYDVLDGEGGSFRAFPDFLIEIDGVEEIHEVKPDAEYARPDVRRRLELTAAPPSATDIYTPSRSPAICTARSTDRRSTPSGEEPAKSTTSTHLCSWR